MKFTILLLVCNIIFIIIFILLFTILMLIMSLFGFILLDWRSLIISIFIVVFSILIDIILTRLIFQKISKSLKIERNNKTAKVIISIFVLLYLMTYTIGIPLINTKFATNVIGLYKDSIIRGYNFYKLPHYINSNIRGESKTDQTVKYDPIIALKEDFPSIKTYFSVPIFPFLVISYNEYMVAPLYGLGYYSLDLWYLIDTINIFNLPLWIS